MLHWEVEIIYLDIYIIYFSFKKADVIQYLIILEVVNCQNNIKVFLKLNVKY